MSITLILCTVPDKTVATKISHALISGRLAACVNVLGPVTSVYEWDGSIQEDTEYQLVIKTTPANCDEAYECVKALHPYDVPEWLMIDNVSGSEPYTRWLTTTVLSKQ